MQMDKDRRMVQMVWVIYNLKALEQKRYGTWNDTIIMGWCKFMEEISEQ